ncbi:MAG: YncE family protein [Acidimicrobiales bacterium]
MLVVAAAAVLPLVAGAEPPAVTRTIPVDGGPQRVAVDPLTRTMYVTHIASNSVTVLDSATGEVLGTIPGVASAYGMAVDPETHDVYVTSWTPCCNTGR